MGDRRHNTLPHALSLYPPQPVRPPNHRTKDRPLWSAPHALHLDKHPRSAQLPPYLLLPPFLQLARLDQLHPPASLTPLPAVTLSPHSLSPPPLRDSARSAPKKPPVKTAQAHPDSTHGNKDTKRSVPPSAPTVTSNGPSNMASKREDAPMPMPARAQRPSIVSQHSNSVPSTPMQVPRTYETRSRSPSPNGGLGSHSPRSVVSEANSTMPTLRPPRPLKCKFETNVGMLGRRRVPYQSDEILDQEKEEPKKSLDPHEDDKLSGDMRELYDRLQPKPEHTDIRDKFLTKVQRILHTEFPGVDMKVHVFGSSGNMLWTAESDVDICIQTPMKRLEEMHPLAEALDKHGMERVVCIPAAKVRIVKIWDPEFKLACDINVNNVAAIENTRMIKTYIDLDDRVRPLAMIIKHWTKRRILNDAGIGGTISSYTWICLILNFLQTLDPPILPVLHDLPNRATDKRTGQTSLSSFADDTQALKGFGKKNSKSLGQLLFHFFRLYAHEVDFEKEAISVRQGKRIPREEKGWHPGGGQKEGVNRLCVEEPFNTDRNLGNSADGYAWRGIHLELRRAFDCLADRQQLDKACEQFEYPPEEKSTSIFQKPQSQKATITSSVPIRNGRGGQSQRGGRGALHLKSQHGGSRRSSGSSSFGQSRPPFLHSPPIPGSAGPEYFSFPRGLHDQLHDQLFQQYQMLEMQSNSLRAQLAAQQQQAHQVRAAHMHAQAVAQAQQNRGTNPNGSPQKSPYANGHHSPRLAEMSIPPNALPQGFLYHYPGFYNTQHADLSGSQDGTRTNPSSPSLSNSVPGIRRGVHRLSNASESNSLRSHSQPPRGVAQQQPLIVGYPPMPPVLDSASMPGYATARPPQDILNTQAPSGTQPRVIPQTQKLNALPDTSSLKEHVGYYPQPQPRSLQEYTVSAIPSFSELAQRRRRVSPEITQPLLNTALRRVSRSPSPLGGHMRSYSTGVSQPLIASNEHKARVDSVRPPVDSGPVIVNGSFPTQPRPRSDTAETIAPEVTPGSALGIYPNNQTVQQIHQINELQARQRMVLEEMQRQKSADKSSPQIANGSINGSPMVQPEHPCRKPSESQLPFPVLPEGWLNFEPATALQNNQYEEVSPTHTLPPQWQTSAYTNGVTTIETSSPSRTQPQEIKSATVPLLSPVFETRTPSPTVIRSSDSTKTSNGTKQHSKEILPKSHRGSVTQTSSSSKENRNAQPKSASQGHDRLKPSAGAGGNNTWQNPPSRKKGKSKKGKAQDQKLAGEPLPANASDRKGG
ncbi:hypothetical protein ACN47E_007545 [Coniothyrium glycines]